jgi:acylpyruvate hydrolase
MRFATVRDDEGRTQAVRIDGADEDGAGGEAVELGLADVGEVLARDDWRTWAAAVDGPRRPVEGLDYAPVVPRPDKIVCVGLNYRSHILERGHQLPTHPTLFAKFRSALIGADDPIVLPSISAQVDWEAELAVVIGARGRHVPLVEAESVIAGYTVLNDVTARDLQSRTPQWLQGKTFEATTPVGPHLVTADESPGPSRAITCAVDGEEVQGSDTVELVFDPFTLVSYISAIVTLEPGDIIATCTPGGVGAARTPPRFLRPGNVVTTRIATIGTLHNPCRAEGGS